MSFFHMSISRTTQQHICYPKTYFFSKIKHSELKNMLLAQKTHKKGRAKKPGLFAPSVEGGPLCHFYLILTVPSWVFR